MTCGLSQVPEPEAGLGACVERDYLTLYPSLLNAAVGAVPWLPSAVGQFRERLPVSRSVMPFAEAPYFRPPGSYRCVYYCPSAFADCGNADLPAPVVALKGLEPAASDFSCLVDDLRRTCYSPHNIAEHLVFEEHKIPGCLGIREALREAERACSFQIAHLRAWGTLAHLPLPLLVMRHNPEISDSAISRIRDLLPDTAFEKIRSQTEEGLGVYAYYYPAVPIRPRDLDHLLGGLDFRRRILTLATTVCDPEIVIARWICGFVRLLYLGFLPGSLHSMRTGVCCQPQNACIDGGFVDLDSLTPIDELRDDTAIISALQFSLDSLIESVRTLLAGNADPNRIDGACARVDLHLVTAYLLDGMRRALESERRPGLHLDPRVAAYFAPAQTIADLIERLCPYYSPKSKFEAATEAFGEFGMAMLRSGCVR
jgi:hypothetical protein